jgi:hypothetical protein
VDHIDRIVEAWRRERPDVDVSALDRPLLAGSGSEARGGTAGGQPADGLHSFGTSGPS